MKLFFNAGLIIIFSLNLLNAQKASPPARCGHSMVKIDDTVYLFGGALTFHDTVNFTIDNTTTAVKGDLLNDLWAYSDNNRDWTKIESSGMLPPKRVNHAAVALSDFILIHGGIGDDGTVLDDFWEYDVTNNTWTKKSWSGNYSAPKRYGHVASSFGDFVYLYGGRNDRGNGSGTLYKYNIQTGEGDIVPITDFENHPKDLYGSNSWVQNDKLYIIAGYGGGDVKDYKNDIWEFDYSTGLWKFINASGYKPSPRAFAQAVNGGVPLNSVNLFLIGGEKDGQQYKDAYTLNTFEWEWVKWNDALITRSRGGTAFIDNSFILTKEINTDSIKILLFGGVSDNIVIDSEELYSFLLTDINEWEQQIPKSPGLFQNYPNPFNPTTSIKYQVSINSRVILKVFNTLGQEIRTLVDKEQKPGYYSVVFNAAGLASGVYFYRLNAANFTETKKLLLIK